ncbi:TonB-dependent receptor [Brevundimonas sp.]|uniref:TonB-dependent receptor plug domain-containing protein n=1 Tax=Brevundimonas sp. TaxID=1871086 RepID=UPI00179DDFC4|nr:TonB-dependent receptor [Brevundimonas sp.]MBA4808691.1 TonB-dependent receptor [Brevundimonas sp.]
MKSFSACSALMAFVSTGALMAASAAFAQETPPPADDAAEVGEIIVTGTRAIGRTRLDSVAPVDVITGETLTRSGTGTETASALAAAAPSINFPRPAISDGSDHVRPATLRGLAPDQTLVLINGQRGHVSALVNVNGALGRGSTAFDLNTIPSVALGTVEVLRDGASAQYGSDAIAGVINLRLREAREGGGLTINYGRYDTSFDTARGSHNRTDGVQKSVAGWVGLPFGDEGFLTVSGELQSRDPTNRSDYAAPSAVADGSTDVVLGRFGDPGVQSQSLWLNAGTPISGTWEAYGFGGIQHKETESAATARAYNNANNVIGVYPNGFLPKIGTDIIDYNLYGGVKGEAAGIQWDVSAGYGRNTIDYRVFDSINASYGDQGDMTQKEFEAGGLEYDQLTLALDGVKPLEVGLYEPLNLAFGLEYRTEGFVQTAGEPKSYDKQAGSTRSGGAQGFPGFSPANAVDVDRNNWGAYVDLEGKLTEALTVGLAGRYEDYSDFGDKVTGKLSARYDFSPAFALRGAVSSGFRAPALQQQYFSYIATNLVTTGSPPVTNLIQSGTFRVDDPVSVALGAKPLEPETSTNYSLGAVFRAGRFELTVDAYQIEIENRIILSENLGPSRPSQSAATTSAVLAIIQPLGVSSARFWTNGVDTTTQGVDVVGRYRLPTDSIGRFDFTLAGNYNETTVDKIPGVPTGLSIPVSSNFLFDRANILSFEEGTPKYKVVGGADWTYGDFGVTAKATYYDSVLVPNNTASNDYWTGSATLFDLEGRYTFPMGVGLAIGVNNLTDEYPEYTPAALNAATGSVGFPQYSPYGFNGRFFYGRLSYSF